MLAAEGHTAVVTLVTLVLGKHQSTCAAVARAIPREHSCFTHRAECASWCWLVHLLHQHVEDLQPQHVVTRAATLHQRLHSICFWISKVLGLCMQQWLTQDHLHALFPLPFITKAIGRHMLDQTLLYGKVTKAGF